MEPIERVLIHPVAVSGASASLRDAPVRPSQDGQGAAAGGNPTYLGEMGFPDPYLVQPEDEYSAFT